jgi:hypothetical protein
MTVALGATPVATGVVGLGLLTAVLTRQQLSAQGLGPAVANSRHGAARAGQESRAQPLLSGGTRGPEDGRHLRHLRAPARLAVGHGSVAGGVYHAEGVARQMRGARRGSGTLVAKECVDDAPRHAPRSELGGLGVSERMTRGVFGAATLAGHALRGRLEGSRRERRLLVPSGEHPGPGARTLPASPPQLQGPCGQGHHTVFAPVARAATHQHALRVDVRDRQRRPFP